MNRLFVVLLLVFALPFVLFQDVYPFYRFGMFAETPQPSASMQFRVEVCDAHGCSAFDGTQWGFYEGSWQVLLRSHYYRGESALLLQKLANCKWDTPPLAYHFYQIEAGKPPVLLETLRL
jgi:hypothetical protein